MTDQDVIAILAPVIPRIRRDVKGLSAHVEWIAYGDEATYEFRSDAASDKPFNALDKSAIDWETYVLLHGAGSLQGHMTGFPDSQGRLAEDKKRQFIHQLLPGQFSALASRCRIASKAIPGRAALLRKDPLRCTAILFFQDYLKSVFRTVAGADEDVLLGILEELPGIHAPAPLLAEWRAHEEVVHNEQRSVTFEVDDTQRFRVYAKDGKKKRLVNGWVFGEAEPEDEATGPEPVATEYDNRIRHAGFHGRMLALLDEAAAIIGDGGKEMIEIAAEHRSGALEKLLFSAEKFLELAENNRLPEPHIPIAKAVSEKVDRAVRVVAHHVRHFERLGMDTHRVRDVAIANAKLRRKLALLT